MISKAHDLDDVLVKFDVMKNVFSINAGMLTSMIDRFPYHTPAKKLQNT